MLQKLVHMIKKESFAFLKKLEKNNDREWFLNHKSEYLAANENMISFIEALLELLNKHDKIANTSGRQSMYRIYRDVRFSKNKKPYHTCLSAGFKRATKYLRGSYYVQIAPGNSYVMGGFWGPNPQDMDLIRKDISFDFQAWEKLLNTKKIKDNFGTLRGEQLISAPRGFAKDDPGIKFLRYKQFLLRKYFKDEEVLSPDFLNQVNTSFKNMRPFLDFMIEILSTDPNGIPMNEG